MRQKVKIRQPKMQLNHVFKARADAIKNSDSLEKAKKFNKIHTAVIDRYAARYTGAYQFTCNVNIKTPNSNHSKYHINLQQSSRPT